jgi:hypothetical protein
VAVAVSVAVLGRGADLESVAALALGQGLSLTQMAWCAWVWTIQPCSASCGFVMIFATVKDSVKILTLDFNSYTLNSDSTLKRH